MREYDDDTVSKKYKRICFLLFALNYCFIGSALSLSSLCLLVLSRFLESIQAVIIWVWMFFDLCINSVNTIHFYCGVRNSRIKYMLRTHWQLYVCNICDDDVVARHLQLGKNLNSFLDCSSPWFFPHLFAIGCSKLLLLQ